MRRLQKRGVKRLSASLAIIAIALTETACVSTRNIPKPPTMEFGVIDTPTGTVPCARTDSQSCVEKKIKDLDGYIAVHPAYWEANQNYINTLVCISRGGCRDEKTRNLEIMRYVDEFNRMFPEGDEKARGLQRLSRREVRDNLIQFASRMTKVYQTLRAKKLNLRRR